MVSEANLLLSKIKGKDFISYRMLDYLNNINFFGAKEFDMMGRLQNRLYNVFLKSIDKETARRLKAIDALIDETIESITKGTAWGINRFGAEMTDNYQNWDDPEFRTCDVHSIPRDDNGFYICEANTPYEVGLNIDSEAFLNSHRQQFEDLHRLYYEKESIMRGNYSLRDGSCDYETPRLISNYLGYNKEKMLRRRLVG